MPQPPEQIAAELRTLVEPGSRNRLVARGLARGMIWRDGQLPQGSTGFSSGLTRELLEHGYLVLGKALQLRDTGEFPEICEVAFRVAAESIESAVRRGESTADARGFHLVVAAAAFHLAHLAARSFCLVPKSFDGLNLSTPEVVLAALMRRDLKALRERLRAWLDDERHADQFVAGSLADELDADAFTAAERDADAFDAGVDAALCTAITRRFLQGVARFDFALRTGEQADYQASVSLLAAAQVAAADVNFVSLWWAATLARHLTDELWRDSLHQRLPLGPDPTDDFNELRSRFIQVLTSRDVAEVDLWPSQHVAAKRSVDPHDDLVVALPTSAGKTRIAELCILRALAAGKRVVYVTPLRALSAQIERGLGRTFRPLGYSVSALYGASGVAVADVHTLKSSDIVVATPEKLDFSLRQEPGVIDDVSLIVLDEGHMIGEGEREVRYEVLVQRLLRRPDADQRRLVCLSAVFSSGDSFDDFTAWLRSDEPGDPIESEWRPTRQRTAILERSGASGQLSVHVDGETPFVPHFVRALPGRGRRRNPFPHDDVEFTVSAALALVRDGHRVLVYCPQRRSVESLAARCLELHRQGYFPEFVGDDPRTARARWIALEWLGPSHVATSALRLGVGVHHGSLPRPFLLEVEALLSQRVLPIAIASPTVAQGLDLSCSALVFRSIHRGGEVIPPEEYANVVGRAGRAFVDLDGLTVFPVFDTGRARDRKVRAYERLRAASRNRSLESGLFLLVRRITWHLSVKLGVNPSDLLEYVANRDVPWDDLASPQEGLEVAGEADAVPAEGALEALLSDLDTAILSTVEDLGCTTDALADALDGALRSSLWHRRLQRHGQEASAVQEAVLRARARWIWSRSEQAERRGWFSSGLGLSSGRFVDREMAHLLPDLAAADECFESGRLDEGIEMVRRLARTLLSVHPFASDLPAGWEDVLGHWIRGTPTHALIGRAGGDEVNLIQQTFVYRLVWAVEAVRVQGAVHGKDEALRVTGLTALCLTHGLPTRHANLLAQAGLPSRSMALRVVQAFPADVHRPEEIRRWVAEVEAAIDESFWDNGVTSGIWSDFVASWRAGPTSTWSATTGTWTVAWQADAVIPPAGTRLQVVHEPARNRSLVYDADLSLLGTLVTPYPDAQGAFTSCARDVDEASVVIHRFGPRLR